MAKIEITDKDIPTIEQLHDRLYELVGMPAELHGKYLDLITRMYNEIKKEKHGRKLQPRDNQ